MIETGNNAAMREALDEVLDKIDKWRTDGTMEHWQYVQLFDVCDAALATPPRNCDVGTPGEQSKRMAKFCRTQCEKSDVLCGSCQFNNMEGIDCQFAWAQMPYEEGGAE